MRIGALEETTMDMDLVQAFNSELVSLYDLKPPISKAKMISITKAAMKCVKFYKHVVHSVEKFILKCRADYKIPGMYVIDSIVRQSKHQFRDKDTFGPRFAKNLLTTFKHIFLCKQEDKPKIVRVLNLWMKHKVFPEELINEILLIGEASPDELKRMITAATKTKDKGKDGNISVQPADSITSTSNLPTQQPSGQGNVPMDTNWIQNLQILANFLQKNNVNAPSNASLSTDHVRFDGKLLDYDYDEEEEERHNAASDSRSPNIHSVLANPDINQHLQNLQSHFATSTTPDPFSALKGIMDVNKIAEQLQALQQQTQNFQAAVLMSQSQFPSSNLSATQTTNVTNFQKDDELEIVMEKKGTDPVEVIDLENIPTPPSNRTSRSISRSRSRSWSRSKGRSRSRRRSRSSSRSKRDKKSRKKSPAPFPPAKKNNLSVCSTTLWIGHLSKLVHEDDLSSLFGKYGVINSIDLIPPRGCAFLCMNRRQDASRALFHLQNHWLQGKEITLAWAPGKGMKDKEWKDYWDADLGVSYIPWSKLNDQTDFDLLEEGGTFDPRSMSQQVKKLIDDKRNGSKGANSSAVDMDESSDDGSMHKSIEEIRVQDIELPKAVPPLMNPFGLPPNLLNPVGVPLPNMGIPPPPILTPMNHSPFQTRSSSGNDIKPDFGISDEKGGKWDMDYREGNKMADNRDRLDRDFRFNRAEGGFNDRRGGDRDEDRQGRFPHGREDRSPGGRRDRWEKDGCFDRSRGGRGRSPPDRMRRGGDDRDYRFRNDGEEERRPKRRYGERFDEEDMAGMHRARRSRWGDGKDGDDVGGGGGKGLQRLLDITLPPMPPPPFQQDGGAKGSLLDSTPPPFPPPFSRPMPFLPGKGPPFVTPSFGPLPPIQGNSPFQQGGFASFNREISDGRGGDYFSDREERERDFRFNQRPRGGSPFGRGAGRDFNFRNNAAGDSSKNFFQGGRNSDRPPFYPREHNFPDKNSPRNFSSENRGDVPNRSYEGRDFRQSEEFREMRFEKKRRRDNDEWTDSDVNNKRSREMRHDSTCDLYSPKACSKVDSLEPTPVESIPKPPSPSDVFLEAIPKPTSPSDAFLESIPKPTSPSDMFLKSIPKPPSPSHAFLESIPKPPSPKDIFSKSMPKPQSPLDTFVESTPICEGDKAPSFPFDMFADDNNCDVLTADEGNIVQDNARAWAPESFQESKNEEREGDDLLYEPEYSDPTTPSYDGDNDNNSEMRFNGGNEGNYCNNEDKFEENEDKFEENEDKYDENEDKYEANKDTYDEDEDNYDQNEGKYDQSEDGDKYEESEDNYDENRDKFEEEMGVFDVNYGNNDNLDEKLVDMENNEGNSRMGEDSYGSNVVERYDDSDDKISAILSEESVHEAADTARRSLNSAEKDYSPIGLNLNEAIMMMKDSAEESTNCFEEGFIGSSDTT